MTSNGCPSFSYIAKKNMGSITIIIQITATLIFPYFFIRKKTGKPINAPIPKQINCLFVRLNNIFDFTRVRSRGTGT